MQHSKEKAGGSGGIQATFGSEGCSRFEAITVLTQLQFRRCPRMYSAATAFRNKLMFTERRGSRSLYKFLGSYRLAERGAEFLEGPRYSARKSRKHYCALNMGEYDNGRYDELWVMEMRANEREAYLYIARKTKLLLEGKIDRF
jgi:hypothetical protein